MSAEVSENSEEATKELSHRSPSWRWFVSGLLLFATMINYMDRQTLANLSVRITKEFDLRNEEYGNVEFLFGVTFAVGSLFFGYIADKVSVRWLYPFVLVAWSVVGFLTGLANGYWSLLVCRGLLGFFEAGHWPCALIVTQSTLSRKDRVMGNSLLQCGASLGAILTPILIERILRGSSSPSAWRQPFFIIGSVGLVWAVAWFLVIKPTDLVRKTTTQDDENSSSFVAVLMDRRFWALAAMVLSINTSWQVVRAWLPKFLQEGRNYSESAAMYLNSLYYFATDVGCISAGIAATLLTRRGWAIHSSRLAVYLVCALLAGLSTIAAFLPQGRQLEILLMIVGAGLLGVFPCYYSFAQEMSVSRMGRVSGYLSFFGWLVSAPIHKVFGLIVDRTKSYDFNIGLVGWFPMVGLIAFLYLWPRSKE